ncbi:transposase [Georgenia sp. AZ-5]|uniref:transposase n=1 Tax=Georgenia sp. AZ-5 TaxID=3367526 RepID=UPI0037544EB9
MVPPSLGRRGRPFRDHRPVVEGILYRYRAGIPWRDLPERFRPWQTVWKRHRFSADGTGTRSTRLCRPRTTPVRALADKAYSSRVNRELLRRRGIQAVIPERCDRVADRKRRASTGGRPVTCDTEAFETWRSAPSRHRDRVRGATQTASRPRDRRDRGGTRPCPTPRRPRAT